MRACKFVVFFGKLLTLLVLLEGGLAVGAEPPVVKIGVIAPLTGNSAHIGREIQRTVV